MKKIILISIILIFLTAGCGIFDLSDFVLPDDIDFINTINELNNPEKICSYMKENFTYKENIFYNPDPYTLWQTKKGDCNDFCTFAIFVANYHNYETYQIHIFFKGTFIKHVLAVYLENSKHNYSNIKAYYPINVDTFKDVVSHCFSFPCEYELKSYKVYNYNMNIVEQGYNN